MIGSCIRYGAVRCGFSKRKTNRKIIVVLWFHNEFDAKENIFLNQGYNYTTTVNLGSHESPVVQW